MISLFSLLEASREPSGSILGGLGVPKSTQEGKKCVPKCMSKINTIFDLIFLDFGLQNGAQKTLEVEDAPPFLLSKGVS